MFAEPVLHTCPAHAMAHCTWANSSAIAANTTNFARSIAISFWKDITDLGHRASR